MTRSINQLYLCSQILAIPRIAGTNSMSLDRDISQRLQDKYDPQMAVEAREWIEAYIGEELPDEDFMDGLKDGTVLCRLLNVVKPGSTKYKVSKMPFVQVGALSLLPLFTLDGKYLEIPRRSEGISPNWSRACILM